MSNHSVEDIKSESNRLRGSLLDSLADPVTGALREQLNLPKGFGLVVDFVAKDSPAEAAGLKVHDVLTRLDDPPA